MAYPKISTINNVYIGSTLNTQWNANGGTFGTDPLNNNLPFVGATSTPSFFGAANYDASSSSFSALVAPAPAGNGSVQTSLLIKHDENNFVEMFVGPNGVFGGYTSNDSVPRLPSNPFPAYDPVAHAYWRIRNDSFQFFFDTSPNGTTWTTLNSVTYDWSVTQVTVMFLAGFTGIESSQTKSYISIINGNVPTTTISGSVVAVANAIGIDNVITQLFLAGSVHGFSGTGSQLNILSTVPEGGLTDFSVSGTSVFDRDPISAAVLSYSTVNTAGGATRTWVRPYIATSALSAYRNQEFWTKSNGAWLDIGAEAPDTNMAAFTNVQLEKTVGQGNRLSTNVAFYTETCEFVASHADTVSGNGGSISVVRSKDHPYAGNYSGKMVFGGEPVADGSGHNVYYPFPTKAALTPIITNVLGQEIIRGTVSLSTTRANTQWYAALVLYDSNFNLLRTDSTFGQVTVGNILTHPGSGIWQTGSVVFTSVPAAAYASVVPVVIVPGTTPETVYMSGHSIIGITPSISSYPTDYVDPQQLTVELKADRVNLAKNSGFISSVSGWQQVFNETTIVPTIQDTFTRSVSNGWGTADTGGTWTTSGGVAADFSVNGTKGVHSLSAVNSPIRTSLTLTQADQDIRGSISTSVLATGNSIVGILVSRTVDANNMYMGQLSFSATQTITLSIRKRVAGVETVLATVLTGLTHVANTNYSVRFNVVGSTLRAKAWLSSATEPTNWMLTTTDSSFVSAGVVGCRSMLSTGNTNTLPVTVLYDNFSVNQNPFTRGWDGTVGFNSLGSLKASFVPPSSGSTGTPTAFIGPGSALLNISSTVFPVITELTRGETYTVSAFVRQGAGCPNITMTVLDTNYATWAVADLNSLRTTEPETIFLDNWTRMHATFTVPPGGVSDYRLTFSVLFSDVQTHAPFDFWIDSILVEKGSIVNEYFDGNFSSPDYQFEKQSTSPDNRSYYYKDFTNKLSRVNRIIPQVAPLGTTANVISAQSP